MTTAVDLSALPAPVVVEQLDLDTIVSAMLAELEASNPDVFADLQVTDPAYAVIQVCAYRELLVRQRANDSARAVMLAFATDSDLDHIGAAFGVARLVVDPGDPDAVPPVDPTYQTDDAYRASIVAGPDGFTVAGPRSAYEWHARAADGRVVDVDVYSPTPGAVQVTILADGAITGVPSGAPPSDLLDIVEAALTADDVRPLTDSVTVAAPTVIGYTIEAELFLFPGPESEPILEAATASVVAYAARAQALGRDVVRSAIFAALHVEGVQRVNLIEPAADVAIARDNVAYLTADPVVTLGGYDE